MSRNDDARPLYISCVLWGKEFREHFLEYFIPSLLSPNNIPALTRPVTLLLATTLEDYAELEKSPHFDRLKQFAEAMLFEIPLPQPGVSGCEHMGIGHLLVTAKAFNDGAYLSAMVPDMVISDGTLAFVDQKAREGCEAVFCTALRVEQEGFLSSLREAAGVSGRAYSDAPVGVSGREMVRISMDNLHSSAKTWNYDSSYFSDFPVAPFWASPSGNAWIVHSLHWLPLLLDFKAVKSHEITCLQRWTMDGDYLYSNFRDARIFIVQDSDEAYATSWSPANDRPLELVPSREMDNAELSPLLKGLILYKTFFHFIFDDMKRELFFKPIRWHAGDVDSSEWEKLEHKSVTAINYWCGPGAYERAKFFRDTTRKSVKYRSQNAIIRLISRRCYVSPRVRVTVVLFIGFFVTNVDRISVATVCLVRGEYRDLMRKIVRRLKIMLVGFR